MAAPPPPCRQRGPPELMDELVEEILVRAALVCKRWCRVVMDPGFRRRFRQFHRTPPMLGFIVGRHSSHGTHFLPCSSFRPSHADCRSWCPLDARHGRILFYNHDDDVLPQQLVLVVWTPATGEVRRLPMPLFLISSRRRFYWNAALLCVAPGCDHMECPFNVVLVSRTSLERYTHAYIYSSEADEWSKTSSIEQHGYVKCCSCHALVGNAIYFLQYQNVGVMEYDFVKKELSVIGLPPTCKASTVIVLMSVEDGGGMLGFAMVDGFSLLIWVVRESAPTMSGGWTWTLHKSVDLRCFPALSNLTHSSCIIAAADDVGVFVIWDHGAGVVSIDVKSGRVRRVFSYKVVNIIPYVSFCTPALRSSSRQQ